MGNAAVARMIAGQATPLVDAVAREGPERERAASVTSTNAAAVDSQATQPPRVEAPVRASEPIGSANPLEVAAGDAESAAAAPEPERVPPDASAPEVDSVRAASHAGIPAIETPSPAPVLDVAASAPAATAGAVVPAPPADARTPAAVPALAIAPIAPSPAHVTDASPATATAAISAPAPGAARAFMGPSAAAGPVIRPVDDAPLVEAIGAGRQAIGSTGAPTVREGATPSAQSVIDVLLAAAGRGEKQLMQASDEALTAVEGEVAMQRAAVNAAAVAQHQEVAAAFDETRAQISSVHAADTAALAAAHERAQSTSQAGAERASQQATEQVAARVQRARTLTDEHGQRAATAGEEGAGRAKAHLESARQQVSGSGAAAHGDDATAAAKAEVASRVGCDATQQIDRAAGEAPQHLRNHAAEAAAALRQQGEHVATTMAGIAPRVTAETQTAFSMATEAQNVSRQRASAALGEGAAAAVDGLGDQQHAFTVAAADEVAKVHEHLVGAGSEAARVIGETVRDTIADARRALDEQLAPLQDEGPGGTSEPAGAQPDDVDGKPPPADDLGIVAGASAGPAESSPAAGEAAAQVEQTYANAADELHGGTDQIASALGAAGWDAVTGIGALTTQTQEKLAPAVGTVSGALGSVREEAAGSLVALGDHAVTAADQLLSGTGGTLDATLAQADSGLSGGVDQLTQSIDAGVAGTQTHAGDAVADVHRRVGEGERRVSEHAPQPSSGGLQRVLARSILGSIGDWFAEQWNDFVELISSPSFWVGLIVTIVLFPVMGPGALVVGGAAGGFVAGIEQNLAQGKKWWDPHNIIISTFIGAAAGATMAFAIGIVAGLGLEGLAAAAALMGASALIGIVVNLATGQRWDKALLANLFLGWLIERVFRSARGRGRGIEEEPVGTQGEGTATARVRAALGDAAVTVIERAFGSLGAFESLVARVRATTRPTLDLVQSLREHLVRHFGEQPENTVMLDRLQRIARGELQAEKVDIDFLQHEMLERGLIEQGVPTDYQPQEGTHRVWAPAHDITRTTLGVDNVYHPDALRAGGGGE
jgi:hypothetical protein